MYQLGSLEKGIWCPKEDLNLHDHKSLTPEASASTIPPFGHFKNSRLHVCRGRTLITLALAVNAPCMDLAINPVFGVNFALKAVFG
jgi:hypothetical protein